MVYASKTFENLDATRKAGLWGISMPRRYNGLNIPNVVFSMLSEVISAADAGFQNVWSLQSCIDTLYEFGSEEQRQKYIPRIAAGETMSMDLTEPDAGSDLQRVMLKATQDEDGTWRLNGVKRFITNGDSDIHLVLARSEEGTKDGRGLSMFIYDKRDGGVTVRHIEHKLGIHGSPTCELVYKNAKAELCGSTRMGLIKYVMALMNGARLGIAAQSVGVEQEAYNEGLAYAKERAQFGQKIVNFPAVYDMLSRMKAKLDAGRSLLYQTARYVDIYKSLEDIARERKLTAEERAEMKKYTRLADAFTPVAKGMNSEYANQNAYDAISIHGGSGFIMEYKCQRLFRDARIFSIYEGTTQLQVVAAIRYITNGTYLAIMQVLTEQEMADELQFINLQELTDVRIGYGGRFDLRIGAVDSDLSYRVRFAQTVISDRLSPSDIGKLYWDDEGRMHFVPETAEEVARSGSVSGAADAMNGVAQNPDGANGLTDSQKSQQTDTSADNTDSSGSDSSSDTSGDTSGDDTSSDDSSYDDSYDDSYYDDSYDDSYYDDSYDDSYYDDSYDASYDEIYDSYGE